MQLKPKDSKYFHKKEAKNIRKLHFGFFCPAILKYSSSNVLLRKENIVAQKCKTSQIALKILKILRKKSVVASNSWRTRSFVGVFSILNNNYFQEIAKSAASRLVLTNFPACI